LLYFFDEYTLDTDRRELRRGDGLLPVEPKVFDLLVHLIGRRDQVVSKEDLIAGGLAGQGRLRLGADQLHQCGSGRDRRQW
jgi:DNA-binding winged helix-turn-helix (wHTH) protein